MANKVIISCAITGSIHTPSMSPHLPVTPDEIAASAIGAAEAGAAVLHLHARDPKTGAPTPDVTVFEQFVPRIREATNAIINITTGGSARMSIEERLKGPASLQPEMCSLNLGTMNFGLYPMLDRPREWKHDWEVPYLEATRGGMFKNTLADIEHILTTMGPLGTRFEFECYDIGHLYTLAHFLDRKLVTPPLFVQTVLGILGGIGANPDSVVDMRRTADKLFGKDYQWSMLAAGRNQMPLGTMAAVMGGHVRVGLEDNLWIGKGELSTSNAQQVTKIRTILEELGLAIATPDEARAIIGVRPR
ncbi:3-keto-5-aminohexanoate cleavage protein [Labrys sp. LIt4]|uniref:3-keto-5-aminohexanoate cleavage protein n=1 Tax=Labrys okinawensis TaxID=346911 RepID=A0A2S9QHT2_9HYPH|nr:MULTISPECIES: 3-keto-5-aminohexanoate cleavage protein [Labrys]MBP0582501.1 3-keto-5-aminohexanoate cleavage protein [Labrys sp. LIt4]PRH88904.1 3-keto-5-aminohexanoate cleavage protein [Labrys okinawensis]